MYYLLTLDELLRLKPPELPLPLPALLPLLKLDLPDDELLLLS